MDADLVIVGGGPAGAGVMAALARRPPARVRKIVVLERGDVFGHGLPYGEAADPRHTYGRVPVKRRDTGERLREQLERACATLAHAGIEVDARTRTPAERFAGAAGGYRIDCADGWTTSPRVVLCTGHWHVDRLAHVARAVRWRWDVRRLHAEVADDEDVVVLGTSQSAIDVAIALGGRRDRRGKTILASRRGRLPAVWGPTNLSPATRRGAPALAALRSRQPVRLAEILAAIRDDVIALGGDPCEAARLDDDPFTAPGDGIAQHRDDLAAAISARRAHREIPWQAAVWRSMPAALDLFPRLCAEDRLALAPRWPDWLRYLEAIHVAMSARLLELVDAGLVEVHALGDGIAVTETDRVRVRGAQAEVAGDRLLDARGPEPHIAASDDAFLHSVLSSGHAVSARIPFIAPPDPARDHVIVRDGRPYLETGGLWLDLETFRVRDDTGTTGGLYALGALAQGQLPTYLGLWGIRQGAERIAAHLRST